MNGLEKLHELFEEAQRRIKPENYKGFLSYCLGVMSSKIDKTDLEVMRDGIKKYEV